MRKMMNDYIIRATAADSQIRAFACLSTEIVESARQAHDTSPVVTAALGRLLTAGSMMGSMMKGEKDLLTLKIACSGPIGGLTVTADSEANVKGYANQNAVNLPPSPKGKLDVGKALDIGVLSVIKDMGLKEPYVGQTDLVTGEIAEDLTYYFATSEQVPSSVALGVLMNRDNTVRCAGGFIIQLLPFAEEEVIEKLEKKIGEITSVTSMLDKGMTPEEILQELLGEFGLTILDKVPTKFTCNCTKERVEKAIVSIGKNDLQEMIDDGKPIEVNCHFCNTNYEFSVEELKDIINRSK
jgi:molecular chaperone Hsp33